ncbi:MAG: hypothetical protein ACR2GP_04805 [Burkholderiaceae bacterium]
MSNTDVDLAQGLLHLQQAIQAFEAAGYVERRAAATSNFAIAYVDLGLYFHARRLQATVVELARSMGARLGLVFALGNLVNAEIRLGAFDAARTHLSECAELAPALGEALEADLAYGRGHLALAEGDPRSAVRHCQSAVRMALRAGSAGDPSYLAMLGRARLANGDTAAALKDTAKASALHRAQSFAKPNNAVGQDIWWWHYRALIANDRLDEAGAALTQARALLLEGIANLHDEGLRRNYLNKVEVNRDIIAAWLNEGARRKLTQEERLPHLAIESNVREPFKRLADTGLRLNALHTVADIPAFLVEEATELSGG